jgi:hypothetical protein
MSEYPWPYQPEDEYGWPDVADADHAAVLAAKLEVRKKRTDEEIAQAKSESDGDMAVEASYYAAVIDVAKGAIARAQTAGDTVQKAAAAVGTIYTAILGATFAATSAPLPGRALFPAVFLGLAIGLATVFLAFLPNPESVQDNQSDEYAVGPDNLVALFVKWSRSVALQRSRWLRAAVVALATAVALLPAPFVHVGSSASSASVPKTPAWPAANVPSGSDPDLEKILYTAQVQEVASARAQPIAAHTSDSLWWAIAIVGFAGMTFVFVKDLNSSRSRP